MRIRVQGEGTAAGSLRAMLQKAGYALTTVLAAYTIHIEQRGAEIIIDGVDSELERTIVNNIAELTNRHIVLQRAGGIQSDKEIRVVVPMDETVSYAVERGILRGLMQTSGHGRKRHHFWRLFAFILCAALVHSQETSPTTAGGGGAVTAAQGTAAADAAPWPVKICVGGTCMTLTGTSVNVNLTNATLAVTQSGSWTAGRTWTLASVTDSVAAVQSGAWTADVTDRAGRLLGVIYGSQGQQLQQSATNFNLFAELRTGGTAYDARQIRALTSSDVVSINGTVPVSGSFWQATQPVSGTVTTTPPANASTNMAQIGGTNISTGTGASGAGIPRVTVSNDSQVRILGNGGATLDAAPGAALPTNVQVIAGRDSTQTGGGAAIPLVCDKSAVVTATAAATVIVVALAASKTTRVCGFVITGAGAAGTMTWKSGTGTTCGTATTNLTGAMATAIGGTIPFGNGWGQIFQTAAQAQDLCVTMATASATAAGIIAYAQF